MTDVGELPDIVDGQNGLVGSLSNTTESDPPIPSMPTSSVRSC